MENFQFCLLTYHLEVQIFLREEAPDIPTIVPWCGSLRNMFVSHTVPRHTYSISRKLFCHTPGLTHDISAASQTGYTNVCCHRLTSLVTCNSTSGGLPSGLGFLRSGPASANIFLTRVN